MDAVIQVEESPARKVRTHPITRALLVTLTAVCAAHHLTPQHVLRSLIDCDLLHVTNGYRAALPVCVRCASSASHPVSFVMAAADTAFPSPGSSFSSSSSPSPTVLSASVPFYSVAGFSECGWYRRAVCIAQDFLTTAEETTAASSAASPSLPSPLPPPRIEAVTIPRQSFRLYLLQLMRESVDLGDHYSCPVVLSGSCRTTAAGGSDCRVERLVGGYADFERLLRERYGFVSSRCGRPGNGAVAGQC
jgi:hypothetical protein